MIRFSYNPSEDAGLPYRRYAIEGDNRRGFAFIAWDGTTGRRRPLKHWFHTLADALNFCAETYSISRNQWCAPDGRPQVDEQLEQFHAPQLRSTASRHETASY
jgi:hypothetical protein